MIRAPEHELRVIPKVDCERLYCSRGSFEVGGGGGESGAMLRKMTLNDYKTVLYRQEDGSWVAEVPAISGCYALMPTRAEALSELANVFELISEEYREKGQPLPHDTTEIVNA